MKFHYFSVLLFFSNYTFATDWYAETLYDSWRQTFSMEKKLFELKTEPQDLVIFENAAYGRVLAPDGVIQTTEKVVWGLGC